MRKVCIKIFETNHLRDVAFKEHRRLTEDRVMHNWNTRTSKCDDMVTVWTSRLLAQQKAMCYKNFDVMFVGFTPESSDLLAIKQLRSKDGEK